MIAKKIKSIDFGLLSPDMLRKISTVRIVTPDTYDDDGYPIEGGLMDLRLGVIDPGLRCKTCGGRMTLCSGHFGHIELVRPIVHIGYVKLIYTLLKATCRKCGRVLIPPTQIEKYKEMLVGATEEEEDHALEIIEKTKKASKCPHCGEKQENVKLLKPTTFYEGDQRLFPSQIRERLERIGPEDLKLLGINPNVAKPEWTILTVVPVPPVTTRPSITLETGERSEDDLTHKLVDILRINQRLSDNISAGAPQLIIEDLWDLLQYHVTTYFHNEVSGIPPARHRSGRPLKTLFQRLKGKEGRFRYNLSGKRVNFSARTVVTPDPELSISQVGVPQEIANELTIPEYVTEWNIDKMKELVLSKEYPTANYLIRADNKKKKIADLNREEVSKEVEAGCIVERQLMDGDIVIFNRQPSLHRLSMMAHEVKVMPGKTFRMNDAVSTPYNADYDGDEMNLHVPQTEEAKVEAESLMKVENQIISVRHGRPIIHGGQDHVSGAYMLTRKETVLDKETAEWLMGRAGLEMPKPDVGRSQWSGKALFSALFPKDFNIEYKSRLCRKCGTCDKKRCEYEAYVTIENGKLLNGAMDVTALAGEVLSEIYRNYGAQASKSYLDHATKLCLAALSLKGFTISVSDLELGDAKATINGLLTESENRVDEMIAEFRKGKLERVPGKTAEETLEDLIMAELGKVRDKCGRVAEKALGKENHAIIMSKSGARGKMINVTQMSACVGQTALRGKRILRGYRNKTLPHFLEGDISAKARGFIRNSYKDGLTPLEYYFHSMSGRDALVDKGIRTAKSGYMQRRLINALQDISLRKDGTVRDSTDTIIQFKYGDDGADPMKCYGNKALRLGNEK